jgi:hypothetical protein
MGVSGFGPAPQFRLDECQRLLRKVVQRAGPNDAPSKLPRLTESIPFPHPALSTRAANTLERAGAGKESTEPLALRPRPQSHLTHDDGNSVADAEAPRPLDVEDFRRWWRQRSAGEAAQARSRGRKLTHMAIALAGIAVIGSVLALKGGGPALRNTLPLSPPANNIANAQNNSGKTTGPPSDISAMSRSGLSGAAPIAPEVDAQAVEGLASKASTQTTNPEPARSESARPDGSRIALQVSSTAKSRSAADAPKPPARPASEHMYGAVGTTQPSTDLRAKHLGKPTARVAVVKAEADALGEPADTPIPPLPIGTPAKPEKEASPATTPATSAEATRESANPWLRVLDDLFGWQAFPARQSIDFASVGSTGWAVQLGAPRSEAEAKKDLKRLNARYGSALRGSTVGLRKVLVNGQTVYRLHVVGLSRNEAAALCSRVKSDGGSCSIIR